MSITTQKRLIAIGFACATGATLAACEQQGDGNTHAPAGSGGWLTGSAQEKFNTLADQHGGFSQTMIEVGYRFNELHWAGEDENWAFADYQIEHIEEAMEAGFQRRPEYRASAQMFMNQALPGVSEAVAQEDRDLFRDRFNTLVMHCNACHAMAEVGFIHVHRPSNRHLPWGAP